jgi:hypothetical protein
MLPRGQGIATSPALSQDSVYLLVLAIKMACNILRVPRWEWWLAAKPSQKQKFGKSI